MLVKKVPRGAGLEAWRLLVQRFDKPVAGRVHAILHEILNPTPFPQQADLFESALAEWEQKVVKWEGLASDLLNDAVKRQVLVAQAPPNLRVHLALQGHTNYTALRDSLMEYVVNSKDWSQHSQQQPGEKGNKNDADAMDIGALTSWQGGGKGKGGKGGKGSYKGKRWLLVFQHDGWKERRSNR